MQALAYRSITTTRWIVHPRIQKERWVGKGRVPNREPKEPLGFSEYIFPELHNNRTLKVTPLNANSKFKAVHTSFFPLENREHFNVKQLAAGCLPQKSTHIP